VDYEPSSVAVSPGAGFVAVGGALDNKVSIHNNFKSHTLHSMVVMV
jgi:hypothetical protein